MRVELCIEEVQLSLGLFFLHFGKMLLQPEMIQGQLDCQDRNGPDGDVQQGRIEYIHQAGMVASHAKNMTIHIHHQRYTKCCRNNHTSYKQQTKYKIPLPVQE